ncbi:hypothetical protein GWI33_011993 [Rhynchophorus ferrugineus]|uniref:Uncharacterized protein n=1 Tax=Rhynchophorus ferrugineus TaxID=354439 RepID=A0A834IU87_RHYFE|nr:hypothetical protein GWI33_011993 [Rhynchophorus ferrugineus]
MIHRLTGAWTKIEILSKKLKTPKEQRHENEEDEQKVASPNNAVSVAKKLPPLSSSSPKTWRLILRGGTHEMMFDENDGGGEDVGVDYPGRFCEGMMRGDGGWKRDEHPAGYRQNNVWMDYVYIDHVLKQMRVLGYLMDLSVSFSFPLLIVIRLTVDIKNSLVIFGIF